MKKTSQINKKWADNRAAYYSSLTRHQKDVLDEMQRDVERKVAIQESEKRE